MIDMNKKGLGFLAILMVAFSCVAVKAAEGEVFPLEPEPRSVERSDSGRLPSESSLPVSPTHPDSGHGSGTVTPTGRITPGGDIVVQPAGSVVEPVVIDPTEGGKIALTPDQLQAIAKADKRASAPGGPSEIAGWTEAQKQLLRDYTVQLQKNPDYVFPPTDVPRASEIFVVARELVLFKEEKTEGLLSAEKALLSRTIPETFGVSEGQVQATKTFFATAVQSEQMIKQVMTDAFATGRNPLQWKAVVDAVYKRLQESSSGSVLADAFATVTSNMLLDHLFTSHDQTFSFYDYQRTFVFDDTGTSQDAIKKAITRKLNAKETYIVDQIVVKSTPFGTETLPQYAQRVEAVVEAILLMEQAYSIQTVGTIQERLVRWTNGTPATREMIRCIADFMDQNITSKNVQDFFSFVCSYDPHLTTYQDRSLVSVLRTFVGDIKNAFTLNQPLQSETLSLLIGNIQLDPKYKPAATDFSGVDAAMGQNLFTTAQLFVKATSGLSRLETNLVRRTFLTRVSADPNDQTKAVINYKPIISSLVQAEGFVKQAMGDLLEAQAQKAAAAQAADASAPAAIAPITTTDILQYISDTILDAKTVLGMGGFSEQEKATLKAACTDILEQVPVNGTGEFTFDEYETTFGTTLQQPGLWDWIQGVVAKEVLDPTYLANLSPAGVALMQKLIDPAVDSDGILYTDDWSSAVTDFYEKLKSNSSLFLAFTNQAQVFTDIKLTACSGFTQDERLVLDTILNTFTDATGSPFSECFTQGTAIYKSMITTYVAALKKIEAGIAEAYTMSGTYATGPNKGKKVLTLSDLKHYADKSLIQNSLVQSMVTYLFENMADPKNFIKPTAIQQAIRTMFEEAMPSGCDNCEIELPVVIPENTIYVMIPSAAGMVMATFVPISLNTPDDQLSPEELRAKYQEIAKWRVEEQAKVLSPAQMETLQQQIALAKVGKDTKPSVNPSSGSWWSKLLSALGIGPKPVVVVPDAKPQKLTFLIPQADGSTKSITIDANTPEDQLSASVLRAKYGLLESNFSTRPVTVPGVPSGAVLAEPALLAASDGTLTQSQQEVFKRFLSNFEVDPDYTYDSVAVDALKVATLQEAAMEEKLFNTAKKLAVFKNMVMDGLSVSERAFVTHVFPEISFSYASLSSAADVQLYIQTLSTVGVAEGLLKKELASWFAKDKGTVAVTKKNVMAELSKTVANELGATDIERRAQLAAAKKMLDVLAPGPDTTAVTYAVYRDALVSGNEALLAEFVDNLQADPTYRPVTTDFKEYDASAVQAVFSTAQVVVATEQKAMKSLSDPEQELLSEVIAHHYAEFVDPATSPDSFSTTITMAVEVEAIVQNVMSKLFAGSTETVVSKSSLQDSINTQWDMSLANGAYSSDELQALRKFLTEIIDQMFIDNTGDFTYDDYQRIFGVTIQQPGIWSSFWGAQPKPVLTDTYLQNLPVSGVIALNALAQGFADKPSWNAKNVTNDLFINELKQNPALQNADAVAFVKDLITKPQLFEAFLNEARTLARVREGVIGSIELPASSAIINQVLSTDISFKQGEDAYKVRVTQVVAALNRVASYVHKNYADPSNAAAWQNPLHAWNDLKPGIQAASLGSGLPVDAIVKAIDTIQETSPAYAPPRAAFITQVMADYQ